jgi:hypothetical protein
MQFLQLMQQRYSAHGENFNNLLIYVAWLVACTLNTCLMFFLYCNCFVPLSVTHHCETRCKVIKLSSVSVMWCTGYCYGMVSLQSVPCTTTIFSSILRPHLRSNHSWFIHQSSLAIIPTEKPSSESGNHWREMAVNIADEISLSHSVG